MNRNVFGVVAFSVCLIFCNPVVAQEIDKAKKADIEKVLEVTGALALGQQMSDAVVAQMSQALKASRPDLDPKLFDVLRDAVGSVINENLPAFSEMIVVVYDKHFTHADIKEMLRFYSTDIGQKTIRVMPALMRESMLLGQQWGQSLEHEIRPRVIERFKAEGVDLSA